MIVSLLMASVASRFVVCLDPGHPSENGEGAKGHHINELELVWKVAKRTEKLLKDDPAISVVVTKSSVDEYVANRKRADFWNKAQANLTLRIHADSGGKSGIATYYPYRQATYEGHTGPTREVLAKSAEWAPIFHAAMVAKLGKAIPDLGVRTEAKTAIGAKNGALSGSVFSEVPVFLVELCAVDNAHDAKFASTEEGQDLFARALAAGIKACDAKSSR